ncbi:hypothetical protein HAX54_052571 [Datura stramonium]|uniref:Uncharacterized protein n=1 Tax=Datura stramonium TaxID=4076 RepID=A0ABS8SZQ7_DATST|nr:hypothetical protein [Datura stramonium]
MARKINFQEGDKKEKIARYLDQVRRNLLQTIEQIEDKSDTSMKSNSSQVNDNDEYFNLMEEVNDSQEPESINPKIIVDQSSDLPLWLRLASGEKPTLDVV